MQRKLALLFMGIGLAFIALVARIMVINSRDGDDYARIVLNQQQYNSKTIEFKRGDIVDRGGTVLATSQKVYDVILDAKSLLDEPEDVDPTLALLSQMFEVDTDEVKTFLSTSPSSQYKIVKKGISYKQAEAFKKTYKKGNDDGQYDGLWLEERYQRTYPNKSLACDVIGFLDGDAQGSCGIEASYNEILNGVNGRTYGYGGSEASDMTVSKEPIDGSKIVTTLDVHLQAIAEKHIKAFNEAHKEDDKPGSANTAVIVMNPNNGEILAEASYPVFDLNKPANLEEIYTKEQLGKMDDAAKNAAMNKLWNNYCVSSTYEPGSTVKPFTVATGLETGAITGDEKYLCEGALQVDDHLIHCHNTEGHGEVSVAEAVAFSCNVALMEIADQIGKKDFSKYQHIFGFGERSGIDLPGEGDTGKLLYKAGDMKASDLATNAFGQNFNVTMTQLAAGFCSLINGGRYYTPHVIKEIRDANDNLKESADETVSKKTISAKTSSKIREYTELVMTEGTGQNAQVPGYSIGGKTGTAEKLPRGNGKYVLSYVGYAPVEHPQVLIYVVIDEPNTENQDDSSLVTTLARNIMAEMLPYLGVEQSKGE